MTCRYTDNDREQGAENVWNCEECSDRKLEKIAQ
jgi:hypothetical protein